MFFNIFKHKHKWQTRATNKHGATTYRVCLKCGASQELVNFDFVECERLKEFDDQFDENNNLK